LKQPLEKIGAFNDAVAAALTLSEGDLNALAELVDLLAETSRYHASSISTPQKRTMTRLWDWPAEQSFPVLDFARLLATHPAGAAFLASLGPAAVGKPLEVLAACPTSVPSIVMALRYLTNAMDAKPLRAIVLQQLSEVLGALASFATHANKTVRTALSTCLYNVGRAVCVEAVEEDTCIQLVTILHESLAQPPTTSVATGRLLVAVGSVCCAHEGPKRMAVDLGVPALCSSVADGFVGDAFVGAVKADLTKVFA
jgi:phospholipase A-2-activating protein